MENKEIQQLFHTIHNSLDAAEQNLYAIQDEMERLERHGMYPPVPTEQWQARNGGEKTYLYMLFTLDWATGEYSGPDSKRRIYVGSKPARIQQARRRNGHRSEILTPCASKVFSLL